MGRMVLATSLIEAGEDMKIQMLDLNPWDQLVGTGITIVRVPYIVLALIIQNV